MKGQHYIMTGATSGLGLALLKTLLKQQVRVTVLARTPQKIAELTNKINSNQLTIIKCNLLNIDDINSITAQLSASKIDGLIYSSGVGYFKSIEAHSTEEILETYQLNLVNFNVLFKALLPYFAHNASIVGIGSQAAYSTQAYAAHYGASKAAFIQLLNALRLEHPSFHVMTVNTGPVNTPFHNHADPTLQYAKKYQRIMLDPSRLAQDIIDGINQKKVEINQPRWMYILLKFYNLAPRIYERLFPFAFKNKK
ncbi:SDR family NAD(P)-dependent oxidoreductase [Staphylococcus durrellii]|uniref:SDR family NAD(P)-dependent oxidoreductase n=1 Tax=Staphylococcus durrellii TaxID=2781773 RepID=UPI00189CEA64|nr:SDR family NAD(P)-dependent oxidoreductase [Staphylococcus durrellii]MBF7017058.1 SDR family NAD(P)-dependent oxidoreductase [Staphylococcus durrellii]